MNVASHLITASSINYSVSQYQDNSFSELDFNFDNLSTSIATSTLDNVVRYFSFQSLNVVDYLQLNSQVIGYIESVIKQLATQGIIWSGELKLIEGEDLEQLLIVYRPILPDSSSLITSEDNHSRYRKKGVYKVLIKDLYKQDSGVKKSVVIDEEIL